MRKRTLTSVTGSHEILISHRLHHMAVLAPFLSLILSVRQRSGVQTRSELKLRNLPQDLSLASSLIAMQLVKEQNMKMARGMSPIFPLLRVCPVSSLTDRLFNFLYLNAEIFVPMQFYQTRRQNFQTNWRLKIESCNM